MGRIRDIFQAYFLTYLISFCFGYAPYFVVRGSQTRYLKRSVYYVLILGVIQISMFIYLAYYLYTIPKSTENSLLYDLLIMLQFWTTGITVLTEIILSKLYAKKLVKSFNKLLTLEHMLVDKFKFRIPYGKIALKSAIPLFPTILIEFPQGIFLLMTSLKRHNYAYAYMAYILCGVYLMSAMQIINIQFLNAILIFRSLYSEIKRCLIEDFLTLSPHVFITGFDELRLAQTLKDLSRIHQQLCRILRNLNKIISIQILLSFAFYYIELCVYSYVWILSYFTESEIRISVRNTATLLGFVAITRLGSGIISSHLCVQEVPQLLRILYKISLLRSEKLKREVRFYI